MAEEGSQVPIIPGKTPRQLKTDKWLAGPEILDRICRIVANGGSLQVICDERGILFAEVGAWIESDSKRKKAYEFALKSRDQWQSERLMDEIMSIATVDVREAFEPDGSLKDVKELPDNIARAVQQIGIKETSNRHGDPETHQQIKFVPKLQALELAMKKLDMLKSKAESGMESLAELVMESMRLGKERAQKEQAEKDKEIQDAEFEVKE